MNTDFIQQHKDDRHSDESKNDRQWGSKHCESLRRDLQLCHNLQTQINRADENWLPQGQTCPSKGPLQWAFS